MEPNQQYRKPIKSSILKSGKRTFFFDINVAQNNKKYLKLTESQVPAKEGEKGKRSSFILFPEDVKNFKTSLEEVIG
jgi:hypothetical protein